MNAGLAAGMLGALVLTICLTPRLFPRFCGDDVIASSVRWAIRSFSSGLASNILLFCDPFL